MYLGFAALHFSSVTRVAWRGVADYVAITWRFTWLFTWLFLTAKFDIFAGFGDVETGEKKRESDWEERRWN